MSLNFNHAISCAVPLPCNPSTASVRPSVRLSVCPSPLVCIPISFASRRRSSRWLVIVMMLICRLSKTATSDGRLFYEIASLVYSCNHLLHYLVELGIARIRCVAAECNGQNTTLHTNVCVLSKSCCTGDRRKIYTTALLLPVSRPIFARQCD